MANYTVKARARQGTRSMDLTIPAKLSEEFDISSGDIFVISFEKGVEDKIIYKRVYKNK